MAPTPTPSPSRPDARTPLARLFAVRAPAAPASSLRSEPSSPPSPAAEPGTERNNGKRRRAAKEQEATKRTGRLRTPLPLPSGPGRFTVEPDGTLVFADGTCLAVVRVDAFLNLSALGPYDQERVCREFAALVHGLAHAQPLQAVIESTPTAPDDAIASIRALVTTADPELSGVAADTLAWVKGEVARTHVPDLSGYAVVAPAPERKSGLTGLVEEFRDQMGVRRGGPETVDRRGLDAAVDDTLTQLKASDLPARRLRRADTLAFLWRSANPGTPQPEGVAAACDTGDLAEALTPAYWRERRRYVEHGLTADGTPALYSCTLYFLGSKELTNPGTFADLIAIECNARLSWHLRGLDNLRERGRVLRKRKAFATSVRRAYEKKKLPSLDDEDNKAEAEGLAQELHSAEEGLALSTVVLTLHARTVEELDTARRRALSLIGTRLGIQPGKGRGYQKPLWQASLPLGQNAARRRAKRWHTAVIGNGLPYLAHNPGTPTGFPAGFTSKGHELVLLDLIHQTLSTSVMIVTGAQGMGKCVTPDTLVWSGGLRRFGDVWGADTIQGPHTVDHVAGWYDDGVRDGYRVETEAGFTIDGTPAHRVWVRDDDGYEGWRRMGELTGHEFVALARGVADWGTRTMPLDEAYALGLVIADGCFAATPGQEALTVDKHPAVLRAIAPVLKRWRQGAGNRSTADVTIMSHNDRHASARIAAPHLHAWLADTYGLRPAHSYNKEVPDAVLQGTRDVVRAFLRGYFDGDGYCNALHGQPINVAVSTASHPLAEQVQQLLLGLGVYAARRTKPVPGYRPAHIVAVRDTDRFAREVGFTRYGLRKDRALLALLERPRNTNTDTVPGVAALLHAARLHMDPTHPDEGARKELGRYSRATTTSRPSYAMLRRLLTVIDPCPERAELERIVREHRVWAPIRSITPSRQHRIDCTVDGSHAFIGNGLVNHNTFWLLRCALWARYRGQRVTLIARADHFRPFVELCGGTYIEPGAEGQADPPILNLWDLPAGLRLAKKVDFLIAAHEIMLCNPGQDLDDEVRGVLDRAIQAVYRAHGVVPGEERPLLRGDAPLERALVAHVGRLSREEGLTARKQELLEKLHATLLQYVGDPLYGAGRYAHLVDRPTRVDVEDDVLCWNLDGLAPRLYALTLFTVTDAMAHRAKSTFDATRGASAEFLAIDEGWFLSEFMKAGAELTNWAKRSRHIGLILAFASQQLSEAIRPGTKPIFDAASLKCVFRLADVRETEDTAQWAARTLQCSVEEAHSLTGLHEGQMMLFRQAKDGSRRRGLVGVMAPPLEYWAFTTETWTDVPARNAAVARLGSVAAAIRHLAGKEA